jgi:hypothetical protein
VRRRPLRQGGRGSGCDDCACDRGDAICFSFFFTFAEIVGSIDSGRWFCGMSICPSL